MQGQIKQYRLKVYIVKTIYSDMGDTVATLATSLSFHDKIIVFWIKVN